MKDKIIEKQISDVASQDLFNQKKGKPLKQRNLLTPSEKESLLRGTKEAADIIQGLIKKDAIKKNEKK